MSVFELKSIDGNDEDNTVYNASTIGIPSESIDFNWNDDNIKDDFMMGGGGYNNKQMKEKLSIFNESVINS